MRRLLAALSVAAAGLVLSPAPVEAQTAPVVTALQAIPGSTVDVLVDGEVAIAAFVPGTTRDLSSLAGQTLRNVELREVNGGALVFGPVPSLILPSSGNTTIVAHLTADGAPTLTPFDNDVSAIPAGQGRLTVRHTAAAPAIDVVLADGTRAVTDLANASEVALTLPAGPVTGAQIAPTGGDPIAPIPSVELTAGANLIVYAAGAVDDQTLTFYTQTIPGLGGAPTAVNTGDSPVDRVGGTSMAVTVAALAGIGGLTFLVLRRRIA